MPSNYDKKEPSAARLALLEAMFDCVSSAASAGILVLSEQDDVLFHNERLLKIWNAPRPAGLLRCGADLWPHILRTVREPQQFFEAITELGRDPASVREWRVRTRDGRSIECTTRPLPRSTHSDKGRFFSFRDADALRGSDDQLRRLQRLATVGQMVTAVGHELRNFTIPVTAYAELARHSLSAQHPVHEHLSGILRAAGRSQTLIDKVLDAGRPATEEVHPVCIGEIVRDMLPLLRAAVAKGIALNVDVTAKTPLVDIDVTSLEQMILNLVLNAARAIPAGLGRIEITVTPSLTHREGVPGTVRLTVRDNGIGMDPATAARIFDPWFTSWAHAEGSGLGLSIVREIVVRSSGEIGVESIPGVGTAFHIDLPARDARDTDVACRVASLKTAFQE